ncbi:MAG: type I restriction endonuclease [Phycisphaerae bacterium]|nr:type I restriction endonuclease [Phycisphaerae bacterium]
MAFNEDTRVKIPAILHLTRLGYQYLSLKNAVWEPSANIFTDIFKDSIADINSGIEAPDIDRLLEEISLLLDYEDLGQAFYKKLVDQSGIKLIDFKEFDKNEFHVVTELTCKNGDDEFRPDITLLINGMPLVFIEVKKPNNKEGILAERDRINRRFQNTKFRKFINITQCMVFSNNMEYDDESPVPIEGAFYASPSYDKPAFNYFREQHDLDVATLLKPEDDDIENAVLKDNNLEVIKYSSEFITNKDPDTPTNRICTSLFCKDRLSFLMQYAIAYVKEEHGIEKHIMRYPQMFATKAIERKLDNGVKKGIIWHTQGSGKTALAYYNVKYLTDYFQKKHIIPKFYFIVDRIDLLTQAAREFSSRGLMVHTVSTKEEFARSIKTTTAIHNASGKPEITVVNIHKFQDDPNVVRTEDYDISIQRVYFLDEVHRSYNPQGSFLANLNESDRNAVKIGLTGTPLILSDKDKKKDTAYDSKLLFGDYIHKYYYNASIADGYTLRLIREEIETSYKMKLAEILDRIQLKQGDIDKKDIYAHKQFVEPMLDYIVVDFEKSRRMFDDCTIGGMVVCDSAEQARKMAEIFTTKYAPASESDKEYSVKSARLILHDVGSKDDRKQWVNDFKEGKIDFLFVYNMLLTGFDAKRLKKIYLGRVTKRHNLLQMLTRVNRPYKEFRYGYVVDFADIKSEFDATNAAYLKELNEDLGDEMEHYSNLFKSKEEITADIESIKDVLFEFNTDNAEVFAQQISRITDRQQMQEIKKALGMARSLYNLIRLLGHYDLLEKIDFQKLAVLYREASNRLDLLNLKETLETSAETANLLNMALEDVYFQFTKISEEELKLADELKNILRRTREDLAGNFDKADPRFVSLYEELRRLFKDKNLSEVTQDEMNANIGTLRRIHEKVKELNRLNDRLREKYANDKKFVRIHKRLKENGTFSDHERRIFSALQGIKAGADEQVLLNTRLLKHESFMTRMMTPLVIDQFKTQNKIDLNAATTDYISNLVVTEYINDFTGRVA